MRVDDGIDFTAGLISKMEQIPFAGMVLETGHDFFGAKVQRQAQGSVLTFYPAAREVSPQLSFALTMLRDAELLLNEAHGASDDRIQADDAVQRFRALLPELFSLGTMPDSFRSVVLACHHSLANLDGQPASSEQLEALRGAVEALRKSPFLKFDVALDIQDSLEASGLSPDSLQLQQVVDTLVGEDVDDGTLKGS